MKPNLRRELDDDVKAEVGAIAKIVRWMSTCLGYVVACTYQLA